MPLWGKKEEELPAELRGKTPEQIAQALVAAEAAVGKVPTLEQQLAERAAQLDTQKSEIEALKASLTALDMRTQNPSPAPREEVRSAAPDWGVDADAAFNDRIQKSGIVNQTLYNTALLARMDAERRISSDPMAAAILNKYRAEIDDWYNRCTPIDRAQPGCFDNIFNLVSGRHMRDINEAVSKGEAGFASPRGGAPSPGPGTGGGDGQLSEAEKLVAKRFGMSEEEYVKQKASARTAPKLS